MNRFIQFEYKDKPLLFINDIQTKQILSLDDALVPVLSHFSLFKSFIEKAKQLHSRSTERNLTDDELAAIYLYTDNCEGQSLHDALNRALQTGDETLIEPWLDFLKLFNNALNKLPSVKDTVWRCLPTNLVERFENGTEIVCWGIISCSTSLDSIRAILDPNSILCSIKPLNGKNIHEYSSFAGDYEVLLLPNTHLMMKNKEWNTETNKSIIYLEEISNINDEQTLSTDVIMGSPPESMDDKEIDEDDHDHRMKIEAVVTFVNGDRYRLKYQYGKKRDDSEYASVDGTKFQGEVADEKATGEGICVFENGNRFIGAFERGLKSGHGILYKKDGSITVGVWNNDQPNENDLQKLTSNAQVYQWKDVQDCIRWYGNYDDGNGNKYIGNILDGKADRIGIRFWSDGSRYEGYFQNDKKHGYGIYYYTENDKYAGQWLNDEIEGQGELSWSSGTCYKGDFLDGKKHGKGRLMFTNGKISEGEWKHDNYLGEMMCYP